MFYPSFEILVTSSPGSPSFSGVASLYLHTLELQAQEELLFKFLSCYRLLESNNLIWNNLKKDKLKTKSFELHYPQQNIICHKQIIPTKLHFSLY